MNDSLYSSGADKQQTLTNDAGIEFLCFDPDTGAVEVYLATPLSAFACQVSFLTDAQVADLMRVQDSYVASTDAPEDASALVDAEWAYGGWDSTAASYQSSAA